MKSKKIREDILAFGVLFVISLVVIYHIIPGYVSVPKAAKGLFTPRTFPYMCFYVIGFCSLIGLVKNILAWFRERNSEDFRTGIKTWKEKTTRERIGVFMPWICAALCVLYAVLFGKIGFIWSTVLIAPTILFILGDRKPMHYVWVYAFCAAMYVIFRFVLKVRLP